MQTNIWHINNMVNMFQIKYVCYYYVRESLQLNVGWYQDSGHPFYQICFRNQSFNDNEMAYKSDCPNVLTYFIKNYIEVLASLP